MAKKNHYLEMLEHIEQTAPELSALLDKYTEQYDDADPDDYGTPAEARALAVDLIGQYIRQLTAYLEELKAEEKPKARAGGTLYRIPAAAIKRETYINLPGFAFELDGFIFFTDRETAVLIGVQEVRPVQS